MYALMFAIDNTRLESLIIACADGLMLDGTIQWNFDFKVCVCLRSIAITLLLLLLVVVVVAVVSQ